MAMYLYTRGQWEETQSIPDQQDNEDEDTWLLRCGYIPVADKVGGEYTERDLRWYRSAQGDSYLIEVCPAGSSITFVVAADTPSLLMFLRDFAPVFVLPDIAASIEDLQQTTRRAFRALHGHDAANVCAKCDPARWSAQRKQEAALKGPT